MNTVSAGKRPVRWPPVLLLAVVLSLLLPLGLVFAAGDPTQGKTLYDANCAVCHGADAAGGKPIGGATSADLRWATLGPLYGQDLAKIHASIMTGVDEEGQPLDAAMPHWQGKLTDAQVDDIIAYLQTTPGGGSPAAEHTAEATEAAALTATAAPAAAATGAPAAAATTAPTVGAAAAATAGPAPATTPGALPTTGSGQGSGNLLWLVLVGVVLLLAGLGLHRRIRRA